MVADYRGHRQTLLPVREINLKACTPIIVKQFIQPTWGSNPGPADNRFRLRAHCANEPQRILLISRIWLKIVNQQEPSCR